jgi:hypothetical protein
MHILTSELETWPIFRVNCEWFSLQSFEVLYCNRPNYKIMLGISTAIIIIEKKNLWKYFVFISHTSKYFRNYLGPQNTDMCEMCSGMYYKDMLSLQIRVSAFCALQDVIRYYIADLQDWHVSGRCCFEFLSGSGYSEWFSCFSQSLQNNSQIITYSSLTLQLQELVGFNFSNALQSVRILVSLTASTVPSQGRSRSFC